MLKKIKNPKLLFIPVCTVIILSALGLYLIITSNPNILIGKATNTQNSTSSNGNKEATTSDHSSILSTLESENYLISQSLDSAENSSASTSSGQCAWPNAVLTSKSGNDLSIVVDKKHCLPSSYAPSDLVDVGKTGVYKTKSSMQVRQVIIADMMAMITAMHAAGLNISVVSCYRSYTVQQSVYSNWVSKLGQTEADRISARPGHSEHQLGTVCDFSTNEISHSLSTSFANTAAGKWMKTNAPNYGFKMSYPEGQESATGYSWEPWHWRYVGK